MILVMIVLIFFVYNDPIMFKEETMDNEINPFKRRRCERPNFQKGKINLCKVDI